MRRRSYLAGVMLLLSALGAGAVDPDIGDLGKIKGFKVPSYDEEGWMTSQLFGEYAQVLPDGIVEITGLKVEFYDDDMNPDTEEKKIVLMTVTSPKCYYQRKHGVAASDQSVRIARDNMVVTGDGFVWHNRDERLVIMKNSKVVLKGAQRQIKEKGEKP